MRRLLKTTESVIGPLKKANGVIATTEDITEELGITFVEGRHLAEQQSEEERFQEITGCQRLPANDQREQEHLFRIEFSLFELKRALATFPQPNALVDDHILVFMLKRVSHYIKLSFLKMFIECWEKSCWPWKPGNHQVLLKPRNQVNRVIHRALAIDGGSLSPVIPVKLANCLSE